MDFQVLHTVQWHAFTIFLVLLHVVDKEKAASLDLSATSLQFPTQFLLLPATNKGQRNSCLLAVSTAIGTLRRRELGRGRNRAPNYKVTRENQSHLELSWYWRHRAHQTVDQWVSLGWEGRRRGPEQDIAPKKVCHTMSKLPPKLCGIQLPVQMFQFECSLVCFGCMPTPHLPGFETSITDYNKTEVFNKVYSAEV